PGFGYSSFIGQANGVNDSGQVTGAIEVGFSGFPIIHNDAYNHYVTDDIIPTWDPGSSDYSGGGNAINNLGHVAGGAVFPNTRGVHPFLYDSTGMLDISNGAGGNARGINSSDEVVGSVDRGPFLYTGGALYLLNNLIGPSTGWDLAFALDINDSGQIVGTGYHNGVIRAYLMTPQ